MDFKGRTVILGRTIINVLRCWILAGALQTFELIMSVAEHEQFRCGTSATKATLSGCAKPCLESSIQNLVVLGKLEN